MNIEIFPARLTDIPGILATIQSACRVDRISLIPTEDEVRALLTDRRVEPAEDLLVASHPQAGIVAFSEGVFLLAEHSGVYSTRGFVHPDYRGRGIGTRLLLRQIERYRTLADRHPLLKVSISAKAQDNQKAAIQLLQKHAFEPARVFFEMDHNLKIIPDPRDLPQGLVARLWQEHREDEKTWHALTRAFEDHWGYQPEDFSAFQERIYQHQIEPGYSLLVWDGEEVVAGSLNCMGPASRVRFMRNLGWVMFVFVDPTWRRQGVGQYLVNRTMEMARSAGHSHLRLNVDAANPTGAVALYEKSGFHIAANLVLFQRQ
jgi:mycothiol synthase